MNKLRAAAYCRVSTNMEDQLHSLDAQRKYFADYIISHDDYTLIEVYYNEKYVGDLTQWKVCCTNYPTKKTETKEITPICR